MASSRNTLRFSLEVLLAAGSNWIQSQAFLHAAALAFFTLFSIAPVTIVAVAVIGLVLGERAASGQLMGQLQEVIGPQAAQAVETAVANSHVDASGIWPSIVGAVAIAVGATTVFAQMQQALNAIWDVVPRPSRSSVWIFLKSRLLSLTIVLAIGFVLLVSLLLSVALRTVVTFADTWLPMPGWAAFGIEALVSLLVITALFAAVFRILPDVVLAWRDVLPGAVVTAVLFSAGRTLIAFYLTRTATASTYGAAGSLVLLLLWVNYSAWILLYGAAFTRAHFEARGRTVRPRSTAARVYREIVDEPGDPRSE